MYADICTKEPVCACVLHVVVYVGVGNIRVCVILHFSGMSGVFVHVRPPLACPLLAAALLSGALV